MLHVVCPWLVRVLKRIKTKTKNTLLIFFFKKVSDLSMIPSVNTNVGSEAPPKVC